MRFTYENRAPVLIHEKWINGRHAPETVARALDHHTGSEILSGLSDTELQRQLARLSSERASRKASAQADYQAALAEATELRAREREAVRVIVEAFDRVGGSELAGESTILEVLAAAVRKAQREASYAPAAQYERPEPSNSDEIAIAAIKGEVKDRAARKTSKMAELKAQLAELGVSL